MAALITFLEGIASFASPCLLPMLPLYLAYFSRGSTDGARDIRHTLACALSFVCGFTLVFCILGAASGTLGAWLASHHRALEVACGAFVIVLGLGYLDVIPIGAFEQHRGPHTTLLPQTPATSVAFGIVFAISWTPCVGTFLASALSLAASSATAGAGIALLLCYSAGMGLPFVLAALTLSQLQGTLAWLRAHQLAIKRASGALLIGTGVLMATDVLGVWLRLLS